MKITYLYTRIKLIYQGYGRLTKTNQCFIALTVYLYYYVTLLLQEIVYFNGFFCKINKGCHIFNVCMMLYRAVMPFYSF